MDYPRRLPFPVMLPSGPSQYFSGVDKISDAEIDGIRENCKEWYVDYVCLFVFLWNGNPAFQRREGIYHSNYKSISFETRYEKIVAAAMTGHRYSKRDHVLDSRPPTDYEDLVKRAIESKVYWSKPDGFKFPSCEDKAGDYNSDDDELVKSETALREEAARAQNDESSQNDHGQQAKKTDKQQHAPKSEKKKHPLGHPSGSVAENGAGGGSSRSKHGKLPGESNMDYYHRMIGVQNCT